MKRRERTTSAPPGPPTGDPPGTESPTSSNTTDSSYDFRRDPHLRLRRRDGDSSSNSRRPTSPIPPWRRTPEGSGPSTARPSTDDDDPTVAEAVARFARAAFRARVNQRPLRGAALEARVQQSQREL